MTRLIQECYCKRQIRPDVKKVLKVVFPDFGTRKNSTLLDAMQAIGISLSKDQGRELNHLILAVLSK